MTSRGKSVTFEVPEGEDWWHMYAYVDGQSLFDPYAIRGKTDLDNIAVPSESGIIEVVLEDYSGNMSEPVLIPYGQDELTNDPDETVFPDPVLLEAVRTQIGTTKEAVNHFDGTLDLSNLDIQDYTGLEYIKADTINLTGSNLTAVQQGTFNSNVKHIILKDSTSLAYIYFDAFKGSSTTSIDISGCSSLQIIGLNDSKLETIEYGDSSVFSNVVSVDLSGSRFDLSEGTPEKAFVDAMMELTAGKEDIETMDPGLSSLSMGATVVSSKNIRSPEGLFDGNETGGTLVTTNAMPAEVIVDLGAEQTIESYSLVSYISGFGPKNFNVSYSNDLQSWFTIDEVTGTNDARIEREISPAVTARYFKLEITQANASNMCYMMEWALMGHKNITYPAGVQYENQSPNAYLVAPEEVVRVEQEKGLVLNMSDYLNSFATIRGTDFAALKDADFIDPDYDLDAAASNTDLHEVRIEDANGNVTFDSIDASSAETYTVEYITYNDSSATGKVIATQTVYVRGITTVLEKVIAEAEELLANGSLDNTMEAVVEEFNAALAHAKEIVAKDGATQQEINDATKRLLDVMAKVDWKQGDKTVLEVAVDIANTIKPDLDLYVEEGKQEFLDALATAEGLLSSGNAWQDDIDAATDALMEAMANLRMAPNKDILNDMIDQASGLNLDSYTADSAALLNAALANAQAVAADENATQEEVDAAADTLKAAMNGLVLVNGDNNNTAEDNTNVAGNTETTPVGDGTAPTKTGDAGAAGLAALALLSAGVVIVLRKKER